MWLAVTAKQLDEMAQPSAFVRLQVVGLDRIAHLLDFFAVEAAGEQAEPLVEELPVGWRILELQRIPCRRLSRTQAIVWAADRADEQFAAAVLVEEDDSGRELARLGKEEIQDHGLARPRGADDREVAQVALV